MGFGIEDTKASVTLTQYQSDGETIPMIAAGGEKVGDVVVRQGDPSTGAGANQIGVVSSLDVKNMAAGAASPPASGPGTYFEGNAKAGDRIALRVYGLIRAPLTAGHAASADGDRFMWVGSSSSMTKSATGAHELVGTLGATDEAYGWFRINQFLGS